MPHFLQGTQMAVDMRWAKFKKRFSTFLTVLSILAILAFAGIVGYVKSEQQREQRESIKNIERMMEAQLMEEYFSRDDFHKPRRSNGGKAAQ